MRESSLSPSIRWRLAVQGFGDVDDAALCEVEPWLRFTPAVCTALVALGTALALPVLLWALVPLAAFGAVLPVHPFDLVYNFGLRRLTGTGPLPPNGAPRRFACGLGAVWVAATALAFGAGWPVAGYVLGGVLTSVGTLVSVTHFCIPSLIYRSLTGTLR
jgi:hypothetical protein